MNVLQIRSPVPLCSLTSVLASRPPHAAGDHSQPATIGRKVGMQRETDHPDFLLFPVQSADNAKMLALDSSRQQQTPYFQQQFTMDPSLIESFGFHVDSLNGFGQAPTSSAIPQPSSYYDTPPVYADSFPETHKQATFPPMPATPPSIPTSRTSEPYMPGLSTASGPSIASASSSAIGSPYSGNAHIVQENWIDTNHGLGLPAAVMNDCFPNDYMGSTLDSDAFLAKKYPDTFVGEYIHVLFSPTL